MIEPGTPAAALVRKTAITTNEINVSRAAHSPRTRWMIELNARADAYAEVAADVLSLCSTPFGFRLAVIEAVEAVGPFQGDPGATRERAAETRETWHAAVLTAVNANLTR